MLNFSRPLIITTILLVLATSWYFISNQNQINQTEAQNSQTQNKPHVLSTPTIPLRVSGVVAPADEIIVAAETVGVIKNINIQEGDSVVVGQSLVVQSTPVQDANLELLKAQGELGNLQRELELTTGNNNLKQATVRTYNAREISQLRNLSDGHDVEAATENLITNLDASLSSLLGTINFVNNNRVIFSAAGLKQYDSVLSNIYGQVPNYFQGGLYSNLKSTESVLEILNQIKLEENKSTVQVQTLSLLVKEQLAAAVELLQTAENDVFNRTYVSTTESLRTDYLAQRTTAIETLNSLETTSTQLQTQIDKALLNAENSGNTVTISNLDEEQAIAYTKYAELILFQTKAVAQASLNVGLAEKSLGNRTAPFAGVVTKLNVSKGEYVTPGTPLLTLSNAEALELEVVVPIDFLNQLSIGLPFVVDGKTVGTVSKFSPLASSGGGEVTILLTNNSVTVGSSLSGDIILAETSDVYQAEREYLHFDNKGTYLLFENGEKNYVDIIYDAGQVVFVRLENYNEEGLVSNLSINW